MTYDDLDEITRELFAGRNTAQELLDARRAGEQAPPPTIIPRPEYPPSRFLTGVVIYRCTAGEASCDWAYIVDTALQEAREPLRIPWPGSGEDISRALTEQAEDRMRALKERIEEAFREHFELFHPGEEPPDQIERLQREEAARRAAQY